LRVRLATQSGPMLVIDGKIHPKFTDGSKNQKIRSGVGIIENNRVIFAATVSESNFYDFAIFFKDMVGSRNALFLDGAISEMYLKNIDTVLTNIKYGPILSVTRNK